MEFTQELIANEEKVRISWSPGCSYKDGTYIIGLQGLCGSIGPGAPAPVPKPNLTVPDAISFTVDDLDVELFNRLSDLLTQYTDHIYVSIRYNPCREIPRPLRVKHECQDKYKEYEEKCAALRLEDSLKREESYQLLDRLAELGCSIHDINYPKNDIPKPDSEWYEPTDNEVKMSLGSISIACYNETKIYKALKNSGILDKYFPEWYRKGLDPGMNYAMTVIH